MLPHWIPTCRCKRVCKQQDLQRGFLVNRIQLQTRLEVAFYNALLALTIYTSRHKYVPVLNPRFTLAELLALQQVPKPQYNMHNLMHVLHNF